MKPHQRLVMGLLSVGLVVSSFEGFNAQFNRFMDSNRVLPEMFEKDVSMTTIQCVSQMAEPSRPMTVSMIQLAAGAAGMLFAGFSRSSKQNEG